PLVQRPSDPLLPNPQRGGASPAQREAYRRAREFIDNAIAEVRAGATSSGTSSPRRSSATDPKEAFGL
ncbi:MAG TPA: hypothetical protein VE915_06145, partial [Actinomycetota bacterium]|nr:hypothetical protein [Actinomycetota bacterium]